MPFALGAIAFGVFGYSIILPAWAERKATARALVGVTSPILEHKVEPSRGKFGGFHTRARVRYIAPDGPHEAWLFLAYTKRDGEPKDVVDQHPLGRPIDFYYDSREPEKVMLAPPTAESSAGLGLLWYGIWLLVGFGGLRAAFRRWRESRRSASFHHDAAEPSSGVA